jgi:hypothetical protein
MLQSDLSSHALQVLKVVEAVSSGKRRRKKNDDDDDDGSGEDDGSTSDDSSGSSRGLDMGGLAKRVKGGKAMLELSLEDLMLGGFIYRTDNGTYTPL